MFDLVAPHADAHERAQARKFARTQADTCANARIQLRHAKEIGTASEIGRERGNENTRAKMNTIKNVIIRNMNRISANHNRASERSEGGATHERNDNLEPMMWALAISTRE